MRNMRKLKTILFLYSILVLLSGCGNRNNSNFSKNDKNDILLSNEIDEDDSDNFYFIDLEHLVKNMIADEFIINNIAKEINFIPLETTDESLLETSQFRIAKIKDHFYISCRDWFSFTGIMEFDTNGNYIKHLLLKNLGNGPNELPNVISWSYNQNTQLIAASNARQIVLHSFENNTTNKYTLNTDSWSECLLNDETMVSKPASLDSKRLGHPDIPYLYFRNKECEIIDSVFYHEKRDISYANDDQTLLSSHQLFPHPSGDALFQDVFSDTIQRIRSMHDIKPYMVLNRGSLAPSPKDANNQSRINQTIQIINILDTKQYIFIRFWLAKEGRTANTAVWNKETRSFVANIKVEYSDNSLLLSGHKQGWFVTKYISPNGKEMIIPILRYIEGKLYSVIEAEQAMDFIPGVVHDDNPILMIIDIE